MLVSLKGIWDRVYLLYVELQESVLISGCLLHGGRKTFLALEVQGIIADKGEKNNQGRICLFSSCLIRDKMFSTNLGAPSRYVGTFALYPSVLQWPFLSELLQEVILYHAEE